MLAEFFPIYSILIRIFVDSHFICQLASDIRIIRIFNSC